MGVFRLPRAEQPPVIEFVHGIAELADVLGIVAGEQNRFAPLPQRAQQFADFLPAQLGKDDRLIQTVEKFRTALSLTPVPAAQQALNTKEMEI